MKRFNGILTFGLVLLLPACASKKCPCFETLPPPTKGNGAMCYFFWDPSISWEQYVYDHDNTDRFFNYDLVFYQSSDGGCKNPDGDVSYSPVKDCTRQIRLAWRDHCGLLSSPKTKCRCFRPNEVGNVPIEDIFSYVIHSVPRNFQMVKVYTMGGYYKEWSVGMKADNMYCNSPRTGVKILPTKGEAKACWNILTKELLKK